MTSWTSGLLALLLLYGGQQASADIFGSLVNSVESVFGIGQSAPAPGSFLSAEAPVPLDALSPNPGNDFADLQSLLVNASGPIVYKTAQAALFLSNESATDAALSFTLQTVSLSNSSGSLLASYANNSVVLAFTSTNELYSQMLSAGNSSNSSSQEPSFLSPVMNGTAAMPSALQPIEDLIDGTNGVSLNAVISNITQGANPARIVTTGFGAGGGMAQLAAIWAAVSWTQTQIRCITFGAPPVMNGRAGFAFQQFVDLSYVWAYNGTALVNTVLRTTDNNTNPTVDGRYTMDDYQQAIIDAGVYAQSNGTTVTSPGIGFEEVNTSAALPTTSGILGAIPGTISEVTGTSSPEPAYEYANQTEIATLLNPAPAPEQDRGCPLVLCKIQAAVDSACGDYTVTNSTISFVPTLLALPSSEFVITQPYDTHVVIDWDATTRTAFFIWRGSITDQDWLEDAKLKLVDGSYLLSPAIAGIFPGFKTHLGFSEQFREVTDEAANSSVNIGDILETKMNGFPPEKVLCAGHSLGAALAGLCGVWASNQYPSADVLTVVIGQPFTGNQAWVDLFRTTVGREYRIIHQYDIVPQLPPTDDYRAVGLGMWEFNGQVQMSERPQFKLDQLNWQDHACWNYSSTLQNATSITILPNATANVAQADGSASS